MIRPLLILVLCTLALLAGQLLYLWIRGKVSLVGKVPISRFLFFLAKFCFSLSMLCLLIQLLWGNPRPALTALFLGLWLAGTIVLTISIHKLSSSLRLGIPSEQTALVTSGIYRISRNPIYLGLDCLMAASLVYAFSLLNLVAVVEAILLHHRIILAEERFLGERFQEYAAYRASVPRYMWRRGRA